MAFTMNLFEEDARGAAPPMLSAREQGRLGGEGGRASDPRLGASGTTEGEAREPATTRRDSRITLRSSSGESTLWQGRLNPVA